MVPRTDCQRRSARRHCDLSVHRMEKLSVFRTGKHRQSIIVAAMASRTRRSRIRNARNDLRLHSRYNRRNVPRRADRHYDRRRTQRYGPLSCTTMDQADNGTVGRNSVRCLRILCHQSRCAVVAEHLRLFRREPTR